MVKAQEWLESQVEYNSKEKREKITKLYVWEKNLEGTLNLTDFSSLEELHCSKNNLTSLNLSNCLKLTFLNCAGNPQLTNLDLEPCRKLGEGFIGSLTCNKNQLKAELDLSKFPNLKEDNIHWSTPAQTWLEENYPLEGVCLGKDWRSKNNKGKTRAEITELNIYQGCLEGSLNLTGFNNLKWLDYSYNYLTELLLNNPQLTINNCSQLERIDCRNNNLANLDLLTTLAQSVKLAELNVYNNNFTADLVWLTSLVNLKRLDLSYNNFTGSLEPLQNLTKLEELDISQTNLNSGVEYLPESLEKIDYSNSKIKKQLDSKYWADIHKDFIGGGIYKKQWIEQGFNKEQTQQFFTEYNKNIKLIRPKDAKFLHWYLNTKKLDLNWAQENEEEFKDWRDKYGSFGTCKECQQTNTSRKWCQSCNAQHFARNFDKWTSGNERIDQFILDCQLEATSSWNVLEWIPYEQFENIKFIAKGGFGKVEKAQWKEGSIWYWNNRENKWGKSKDYDSENRNYKDYETVALKTLTNSSNLDKNFLPELMLYKMFKSEVSNMVPCYGISKESKTGNYIMVMKFMQESNLKEFIKKNYQELKLYDDSHGKDKLKFLKQIIQGLKDIHRKGLVHRDFHSGNIIVDYDKCHITDLGLCQPVNEINKDQVYGVMPYVAPEVLRGQTYTMASDIYSFGIIMYEILTGLPPFYNESHDTNLALKICQGVRPEFPEQIKYPQLLIDLIKQCWDSEPNNRPTSREVSRIVNDWFDEHGKYLKEDALFYKQYEKAERYNKTLSDEVRFSNYQTKQTVWTSKVINTKQITELYSQSLAMDFTNLETREDWTSIHPNFNNELLVQNWQSNNFTYQQTQDWINIGLNPIDFNLATWLRDIKQLTSEEILNHYNLEQLKQEFLAQQEYQTQIQIPPK